MKNKLINKLFIYAFLFLYALVALISFCHAIEFFNIGNVQWMSVTLAFAFELGLAVCLASILIGTNKRNNIAWLLLTLLVVVQVVGNTYSVFKYISESQVDYYNYLAKPLLFWIQEVSEETVQVIVSWIMGAILPIVALLMTEMVANGIRENQIEDDKAVSDPEKEEKEEHRGVIPPVIPRPLEPSGEQSESDTDDADEVNESEDVYKQEEQIDPVQDEQDDLVIDDNQENEDDKEQEIQIPQEEQKEEIDPSIIENAFNEDTNNVPVIDVVPPKTPNESARYVLPSRRKVNIVDKTIERDAEKLNPEINKK